jgi:hypothetical protein
MIVRLVVGRDSSNSLRKATEVSPSKNLPGRNLATTLTTAIIDGHNSAADQQNNTDGHT